MDVPLDSRQHLESGATRGPRLLEVNRGPEFGRAAGGQTFVDIVVKPVVDNHSAEPLVLVTD